MTPGDALIACLEDLSEEAHSVAWAAAHEWEVWSRLEAWRAGRPVEPYGSVGTDALASVWLPRIEALASEAGSWPALDEDADELYRLVPVDDWRRELAEQAEADAEEDARIAALDAAGIPPPPKYEPEPLPPIVDAIAECISLFSGIGGIDKGFHDAGIPTVVQVEWDKAAGKVLTKRFTDAVQLGDVRTVSGYAVQQYLRGLVLIIAGGFPCQDVSVAGRRAGVAGERSNLYRELVRIADELDPDWLVIENVPGLLTSYDRTDEAARRGDDFATVLHDLTGYRPAVPKNGWRNSGICHGPKRTVAWRVLDARYFGVAQRRRRVFIVACPRDRSAPAAVLLEPEGLRGNPPPGSPPRPDTARPVARADVRGGVPAADRGGAGGAGAAGEWRAVEEVAPTLLAGPTSAASHGKRSGEDRMALVVQDVAHPLTAREQKGPASSADSGNIVPVDREGEPAAWSADVAPTLQAGGNETGGTRPPGTTVDTVESLVVSAYESGRGWWTEDDVAGTLRAEGENRPSRPSNIVSVTGEVAHTLTGEGFDASEDGTGRGNPIVPVNEGDLEERVAWQGHGSNVGPLGTLRAGNGNSSGGVPFVAETFAPEVAATLTGGSHSEGVNPPGRRAEDDVNLVAVPISGDALRGEGVAQTPSADAEGRDRLRDPYGIGDPGDPAHTITSTAPGAVGVYPIQDGRTIEKQQNGLGIGDEGEPSYTLDTTGAQAVAVTGAPPDTFRKSRRAATSDDDETWVQDDVANTLNTFDGGDTRATQVVVEAIPDPEAIGFHMIQDPISLREGAPALGARSYGMGVRTGIAVRRLTPTECERLQGFPDGWTDVDDAADSPRYKQLGNAVATVCSGWIGWRIDAYMRGWRPA